MEPRVAAIVVNWQGGTMVQECVQSLLAQDVPVEVVVVDNASTDGSADAFAAEPRVRVLRNARNLGFGGGNNVYRSTGDPTTLHPDTVAAVGGSQAHLNLQPFQTLSFCIALTGIFPSTN